MSARTIVARRYVIRGRVQGVGFRYFAQEAAVREGAVGWVRNLPDGSVEAFAEAGSEALERFERAIRLGPHAARVDQVDIESVSAVDWSTGFTIR